MFFNAVTIAFNALLLLHTCFYLPGYFADRSSCALMTVVATAFYHGFMLVFDVFILVKTYTTTRENKMFLSLMTMVLLYRLGSSIADLILTYSEWDTSLEACLFHQNQDTMRHYTFADISCDVLATVGSLALLVSGSAGGISSLVGQLLIENVVRSGLTLALNGAVMYVAHSAAMRFDDLSLTWMIQNYILLQLMNMEHVYKKRGQERYNIPVGMDEPPTLSGHPKSIIQQT
ncbi:hypothetical protein CcCBS67573_g07638 [Chytriomyces confervae]|uniref:Uncharacterized protein n=1 Tax=Chytriomyces confervae TaxID=246404 RepID=A0A507EUJ5_9FUNG|nr:hypothetical protein CcCBS67573_g07638 [Chytriomyces confervae]